MPFLASTGDSIVRPRDFRSKFTRDDSLECPHCERKMTFKEYSSRADHFAHVSDIRNSKGNGSGGAGGCEHAGESKTHELMKKRAITLLRDNFPSFESIGVETQIGQKQSDVVGKFKHPHDTYGEGICVEVQYKNKGKDYIETTAEYTQENHSVCWVFFDDWQSLFEAKHALRTMFSERLNLGYTESIDDFEDLGHPITPTTEKYAHIDVTKDDPLQFFVSWAAYKIELIKQSEYHYTSENFPPLLIDKMEDFLNGFYPFSDDEIPRGWGFTEPDCVAKGLASYVGGSGTDSLILEQDPISFELEFLREEIGIDTQRFNTESLEEEPLGKVMIENVLNENSETAQQLEELASEWSNGNEDLSASYWRWNKASITAGAARYCAKTNFDIKSFEITWTCSVCQNTFSWDVGKSDPPLCPKCLDNRETHPLKGPGPSDHGSYE